MIIGRPVRGGGAFAGKSGRKTPNACQASAMERSTITAAHFMSCGLIKTETRGKKIFVNTVVQAKAIAMALRRAAGFFDFASFR
jgi:hypothetical protein